MRSQRSWARSCRTLLLLAFAEFLMLSQVALLFIVALNHQLNHVRQVKLLSLC